jgi:hypothetical protein
LEPIGTRFQSVPGINEVPMGSNEFVIWGRAADGEETEEKKGRYLTDNPPSPTKLTLTLIFFQIFDNVQHWKLSFRFWMFLTGMVATQNYSIADNTKVCRTTIILFYILKILLFCRPQQFWDYKWRSVLTHLFRLETLGSTVVVDKKLLKTLHYRY